MMMETMYDPYEMLFGDEERSLSPKDLLFSNDFMLSDFNTDSSSISPVLDTTDNTETEFDPTIFEKLLAELVASDPTMIKEQSFDLADPLIELGPATREMGTDPMEPAPVTLPIIIKTTNATQSANQPIFFIQTTNKPITSKSIPIQATPATTTTTLPTEHFTYEIDPSLTNNDYQMEDGLPLTPSTSSDSPDEGNSNSPDSAHEHTYSKLLTNFDNLPTTGSLVLTNEEVKLIKQEGYQVPTKLPLNKTEEKILKKIRRKIKNKISAQESRRKKKEYVDALEKQITQIMNENNALKGRVAAIEKSQKTLTQERDLLRSMVGKATPAPSTALMVFAVFFAVLFGIWSPITNKSLADDRGLSLMPSRNYQSLLTTEKPFAEQQETTHSNNYKSRVLLSIDEYDQHHHGPYLPSNNKYKSSLPQQTAAPGYTYSNTVEKYMNKKLSSEQGKTNFKRSFNDDQSPAIVMPEEVTYKRLRSNYPVNENFVVIEETDMEINNDLNESKPVKIIRVERTNPTITNDTYKLAHRTINE